MTGESVTATVRATSRLARGEERSLELRHDRETVPATLLVPARARPAPAALLLHGFSSSKERMSQSLGRALLARGIGSLAIDLPLHGERAGGAIPRNPLTLVAAWRDAVAEARVATRWLASLPEVDARRLGVVGYSLGGFLALMTAADEPALRAVVLAAAGDLPDQTPYASMVRRIVDPPRAAAKLAGRPLLLVNGKRDTTTRPAQATRLYDAAREPKELRWYDGGHWPPMSAIEGAADWMRDALYELDDQSLARA